MNADGKDWLFLCWYNIRLNIVVSERGSRPRKNGKSPIPLQRWEAWGTDGLWLPVLSRTGGMGSLLLVGKQVSQRAALNIAVGAASMLLAVAAKHSPNDKRHKSCDDDSEQNGLDVHSRIYYNKV